MNFTDTDKYKELLVAARTVYSDMPVMVAVVLCQAILESGYLANPEGSELAQRANNLFGIKYKGNAGSVEYMTTEYVNNKPMRVLASFAKFSSVAACFARHKDLMKNGVSWNRNLYLPVLNSKEPSEAFLALVSAGYATDTRYSQKLQNIYDKYVKDTL